MLLGVAFFAAFLVPAGTYPTLRGDSFASIFYYANWHFIANGSNYFDQTAVMFPLFHTWSLAVEEQFYLVWPLSSWASSALEEHPSVARGASGGGASASEMALLYSPNDVHRVYYGTDTRLVSYSSARPWRCRSPCGRTIAAGPGRSWEGPIAAVGDSVAIRRGRCSMQGGGRRR